MASAEPWMYLQEKPLMEFGSMQLENLHQYLNAQYIIMYTG